MLHSSFTELFAMLGWWSFFSAMAMNCLWVALFLRPLATRYLLEKFQRIHLFWWSRPSLSGAWSSTYRAPLGGDKSWWSFYNAGMMCAPGEWWLRGRENHRRDARESISDEPKEDPLLRKELDLKRNCLAHYLVWLSDYDAGKFQCTQFLKQTFDRHSRCRNPVGKRIRQKSRQI